MINLKKLALGHGFGITYLLLDRKEIKDSYWKYSDDVDVKCGVSQGPILSLILFLICINGIFQVSDMSDMLCYGDAITVLFEKVTGMKHVSRLKWVYIKCKCALMIIYY